MSAQLAAARDDPKAFRHGHLVPDRCLGDWFEKSLRSNAHRTAIVTAEGKEISFKELDRWSELAAARLADQGCVRAGDVVAILTSNRPEFIVADVAIARLGAVKLPINWSLPEEVVSYILSTSGAKALVCEERPGDSSDHLERFDGIKFAIAGEAGTAAGLAFPCDEEAAGWDGSWKRSQLISFADPAALYFTGGTTGAPKGVLHSQGSSVALHTAQIIEGEISEVDRLLLSTPLSHSAGLFAQSAVLRGATVLLAGSTETSLLIEQARTQSATWTFLVPTMLYRWLGHAAQQDLSLPSLRTIVYGAAPISAERLSEALDHFGNIFVQLYGQTECPNWVTKLSKRDHGSSDLHKSCGRASIFTEVKVVGAEGETLGAGEIGEVCVRGPYLLDRYLGNEEATSQKFLGDWIRTGDVGVMDSAGYLFLKDRLADMLISGGMNVYCQDVEEVLCRHGAIRNAAVVGVPHQDWGEAVHASVVLAPGMEISGDSVIQWTRDYLPPYAVPKTVEFVEALPETPFGKIDKKAIRARFWSETERAIH